MIACAAGLYTAKTSHAANGNLPKFSEFGPWLAVCVESSELFRHDGVDLSAEESFDVQCVDGAR
jgi:hypothetical protein